MKKGLIIVSILVEFISAFSQTKAAGVTIEVVVTEFYKNYAAVPYDGYITFEKRKSDWYVVYNSVRTGKIIPQNKYLFYNGNTKKFQALKLERIRNPEKVKVSDYIQHLDIMNINLHPYFGYSGWYKDVIKEYEKKPKLSDDELNSLGRAYSAYSMCLVTNSNGYAIEDEIWKLPFKLNCLTPERIREFEDVSNKAIACFKKLADRTPSYETYVGKIGLKHSNEVMVKYSILSVYASAYADKMTLPADLYTNQQLETSRKNLEACPANAILVSYGDNDYYPVLYLQKAKGLRKDVYLVNINLLGLDRFILKISYPHFNSPAISLSVDTSFYIGDANELINLKDSNTVFPVSNLRELLSNGQADEWGRIILAANGLGLTVSKENNTSVMTNLDIKGKGYLVRDEWILLDIIENLNGRKICFQALWYDDRLKNINNHLEAKGDISGFLKTKFLEIITFLQNVYENKE